MSKSKPVDELTIEDLQENPIWEWAIEEENEEQDETWVRPAETENFTEELNGSIVAGQLITQDDKRFSMMCSLDIDNQEVIISSIVFYNEVDEEYYSLDDVVKEIALPLTIKIELTINKKHTSLSFSANKVDLYKNEIKTNLK